MPDPTFLAVGPRGPHAPVKPGPGRMLRDGRLMGLECDDRHVLTEAMGDEGEQDTRMDQTGTGAWPGWKGKAGQQFVAEGLV